MRFYITVALVSAIFGVSASAFAFPATEDITCLTTCSGFIGIADKCGYDFLSGGNPTATETVCMCSDDSIESAYKVCTSCMVENGYMSASEYTQYTATIDASCKVIDTTPESGSSSSSSSSSGSSSSSSVKANGAKGLSPAGAGQLLAGVVVAGMGYYGL